jgi:PAS domain S-box-containing protein
MKLSRKRLRVLFYILLVTLCTAFLTLLVLSLRQTNALVSVLICIAGLGCCIISLLMVIRVTRDRNSTEALVAENAARYHAIIAASNTGAWEYHADTQYQWCSPEYFEMLGYKAQTFSKESKLTVNDVWMELLHPDDRETAIDNFGKHIAKKTPEMYEAWFRMKHRTGEWKWIWSRGRTLQKADGTMSNITLGTHIDMTDRMTMEIELLKYNDKLIKYAHLTAHEVRGPLARLLGLIEVSKLTDNVDYPWFFDKVNHEAHAIDKILTVINQELNEIGEHHKQL